MTSTQLWCSGIAALVVASLVCAWWGWRVCRSKRRQCLFPSFEIYPASETDKLEFTTLVAIFKREKCMAALKEKPHIIPVVTRQHLGDGRWDVVACLFDKEQEEVLHEPRPERYLAKELSADLESAFGGKDMLVLR